MLEPRSLLTSRSRTLSGVGRLRPDVQRTQRIPEEGQIGLPEIEVVELASGRDPRVVQLEPRRRSLRRGQGWLGWLGRVGRVVERTRFLIAPGSFALLEIVDDLAGEFGQPRCVLRVRSDMTGEVTIGVARLSVEQILADPSLRLADGSARLPLPNGARVQIRAEGLTFLARVGGPPLLRPNANLASSPVIQTSPHASPHASPQPAF